ncbi:hypothetical protein ACFWAY_17900 [Rhodococcus sp. NPDC059968]|uniref:hypothetical protein n=1 Tax=Rhodococcus sp. NPDC059968 TaxID=3347017 RepID=UPI00366FB62E
MQDPPPTERPEQVTDPGSGSDDTGLAPPGEQTDEFLARAVTAALAEGMSWEQIATRLGVPPPPTSGGAPTDQDWQNAIAAHENARAQRIHADDEGAAPESDHPVIDSAATRHLTAPQPHTTRHPPDTSS